MRVLDMQAAHQRCAIKLAVVWGSAAIALRVTRHGASAAVFTGINVVLAARRALPGTRVGEGSGLLVGRASWLSTRMMAVVVMVLVRVRLPSAVVHAVLRQKINPGLVVRVLHKVLHAMAEGILLVAVPRKRV